VLIGSQSIPCWTILASRYLQFSPLHLLLNGLGQIIFTTIGAIGGIFSRHLGELNSRKEIKVSTERFIEHVLLFQRNKLSPSLKFGNW
jgi:hypothetical protein